MRVYKNKGKTQVLKRTGITKLTWTSGTALLKNVDLTWKVRAGNARGFGAWSSTRKFKVVPPSSAKAITAFSFQQLSPAVTGVITEATHAIVLTVPYGTNVGALVANFVTTGASVTVGTTLQTSGTTANDFSSPVTYRSRPPTTRPSSTSSR